MAMVTLNATSDTNIPKPLPYKTSSNLRDASFSSYLKGNEETFIVQLAETNRSLKPHISTPNQHLYLVSKKVEDNEIAVFDAEKYFNEEAGDDSPKIANNTSPIPSGKKETPVELYPVKIQTHSGTPSIRSESSLNSRSALLHNIPRNHQTQKTNKAIRKSFLATLGCHCSCGDKNSVDIDDHVGKKSSKRSASNGLVHGKPTKSTKDGDLVSKYQSCSSPWMREDLHCKKFNDQRLGLSREENFRLPALNSKIANDVLEMQQTDIILEGDKGRKSLEVFGSPIQRKGRKSISLDRSLNLLSWDAIVPKVEEIEVSANSGRGYNDTDSDGSSDLFEIESFSTNPSQYLMRQASDGMSSSITQAYAPSEASIEWSVVTASAADFSSMSDIEDLRSTTTRTETFDVASNGKKAPGKEIPRRRPSILSGCNSHKAVNVAGDVHKTNEKSLPGRHQRSEFLMPMTRFHAESELSRVDKRNGQFGCDTGLLTCSQPGRATQVLHKH